MFALPSLRKGVAESPNKFTVPHKDAPILVIPHEADFYPYWKEYGKVFWVRKESMGRHGYRTNKVIMFGFTSLPEWRRKRAADEFRCALKPGGELVWW